MSWGKILLAGFLLALALVLQRPCCFQTVVPEPEGLAERLIALGTPALSDEEIRAYEDDGAVVVRGVVDDDVARRLLAQSLWDGGFWPHNMTLTNHWVTNGGLRALVRDGPMSALAASAMRADAVRLASSANWYKAKGKRPRPSAKWHVDNHLTGRGAPLATVWLALTDAPEALETIPGSHLQPHSCAYTVSPNNPDQVCIGEDFAQNLSQLRGGKRPTQTYNFSAGDVLVLDGRVWHRGRSHVSDRLSISLRFYPADTRFERELTHDFGTFFYNRFMPHECKLMDGPLFPVAFPRSSSTVDSEPWPLIVRWRDLAEARIVRTIYDILAFARGRFSFSECPEDSGA